MLKTSRRAFGRPAFASKVFFLIGPFGHKSACFFPLAERLLAQIYGQTSP